MSTLELKGGLHELISKINDKDLLLKASKILNDLVKLDEPDWWDELPTEIQEKIDKSLVDIEDEANLISHEIVMQKYKGWQKK